MTGYRTSRLFSWRETLAIVVCSTVLVLAAGYLTARSLRSQDADRFQALFDAAYGHYADAAGRAEAALTTVAALGRTPLQEATVSTVAAQLLAANPIASAVFLGDWLDEDGRLEFEGRADDGAGTVRVRPFDVTAAAGDGYRRAVYLPIRLGLPAGSMPAGLFGVDLMSDSRIASAVRRTVLEETVTPVISDRVDGIARLLLLKSVGFGPTQADFQQSAPGDAPGVLVMVLDPARLPPPVVAAHPSLSLTVRVAGPRAGDPGEVLYRAGGDEVDGPLASLFQPFGASRELANPASPLIVEARMPVSIADWQWSGVTLSMSLAALLCGGLAGLWRERRLTTRERHASRLAILKQREMAEATLKAIGDAVVTTDPAGLVTYMNPVAERMVGLPFESATGRRLQDIVHLSDEHSGGSPLAAGAPVSFRADLPMTLTPRDGKPMAVDASGSTLRDASGDPIGSVVVLRDVSGERRLARELAFQANHDRLTGLHNRFAFESRLAAALEDVSAGTADYVVCFLDLDDFKQVNDSCGHNAGDEVLAQVGALLRTQVRENDLLARIGGDEFAIVLGHCTAAQARETAERIRRTLSRTDFRWRGRVFRIGVSIGLVPIDHRFESIAEVLLAADSACYAAKSAGRNRIHVYDASREDSDSRLLESQWARIIHEAIRDGRFLLSRQAIRPLGDPAMAPMVELLVELQTENDAVIKPRQLMSSARRFGLADRIDRHVVELAVRGMAEGLTDPATIHSVNVTAQTLAQPDFVEYVSERCRTAGIAHGRLCFEISEREATTGYDLVERTLRELRDQGFRLAIDEFGSGWGAVSYLESTAVDYVKIAGHLCQDVRRDPVRRAMVTTVNDIARVFGMQTVAKNVEDPAMIDELRSIGVDYAQGFAIEHPVPFYGRPAEPSRATAS
jgi:diguanylate cyclase (GGDEF)-like protein/PAS domain S-box-containing protein